MALDFLAMAALVATLGGCGKPAAPASAPSPAARSVGKPLTDAECLAAGEEIARAVKAGDVAALDRMIDWESVNQRFSAGVDAPDAFRKDFIKGIDQSRASGKGVASSIVDAIKKGGSYTLIHAHAKENRPWLLFRLLLPESGVNYHDFPLARRPDGKARAVDMYVYLSGELFSQTLRRGYLLAIAQNSGGLLGRLTGADRKYAKYFKDLAEMGEASRNGRNAEVVKLYQTFPDDLKKEKSVLLIRLQASQHLGDDAEYARSIEDYRREYPDDPSIDILSIDYHILKKQFAEALACIDRLDRAVLGDPYLQTIRASVHLEQGDPVAARADLEEAIGADPGMVDAYWSLVTVSLKEGNYDDTLRTLRLLRDKFRVEMGDLAAMPIYKGFAGSPQYQEWLKDRPADAADAEGKEKAGKPEE